ncbi:p-loop containing nucleoside triphosphate hydrolase protein [Gigaspora margarita]|uniref:p-loop containing nucleoside triphosphate hydrolase protein n=1 Tax=Gigaspora margarita TaxID=4874 RepID=A0A8H3XE93_GIGMA|nr:p-loop containing nucleoside triphosphate hydrolase protein [Gigaspora margarita]
MNVIVDRCNFNGNQRQVWINLAWSFGEPVDAIIMDTTIEVKGQKGLEILVDFQKWMILPSYEEGFERIISIKSQPTSDSYNDKVIEEILTKLTEEPIVKHNKSVPITNFRKFNIKDENNSKSRGGNFESRNNPNNPWEIQKLI